MYIPYLGEIQLFCGNFAPLGWVFCNGQLLNIAEYESLFTIIGTTYGGDGQTTFAVPNLQGRAPIGVSNSQVLGETKGIESITLGINNIPAHSHTVTAKLKVSSNTADQKDPSGKYWGKTAANDNEYTNIGPNTTLAASAASITLATSGNGPLAIENRQPFMAVNFIIATEGIYPSPA